MKNISFILLLLLAPTAKAQLNTSFEQWSNKGLYEEPDSWSTPNLFFSINGKLSCTKQSPHWGKYAVGIAPIPLTSFNDTLPGYILQKNSISTRPNSISIYYRYPAAKADSPSLSVSFYKGSVDTANLIGSAVLKFSPHNNWTKLSGNIQWKNMQVPDSFQILIINSFGNKADTLFVDDLELSAFNTGISGVGNNTPNIFVTSDRRLVIDHIYGNEHLVVRNIPGEILFDGQVEDSINLDMLNPGLYILELQTSNGPVIRKFVLY